MTGRARARLIELRLMLIDALLMFVVWFGVRTFFLNQVEIQGHATDALLRLLSDVEIHTLAFRAGYDLAAIPVVGAVLLLFRFTAKRSMHKAATAVAIAVTAAASIGMVFYPALVLSGRVASPFRNGLAQSAGYGAFVMVFLLTMIGAVRLASTKSST